MNEGTDPGRRRRRNPEQTRRAIIDALLEAVKDGDFAPTTKTIATGAGVSERSIFVHFPTREDLLQAAVEQQSDYVETLLAQVDPRQSRDERIAAAAHQSETVYALQRRPRIMGLLESQTNPGVDDRMRLTDKRVRDHLARMFAPELTRADGVDEELLDLIDATAGWPYRHHLVERRGLSREDATAAIRRALRSLLA
ncbi:TetR/AcrR family transcriptional regulator [Nocardia mexicana]|uniref:TetR family transcriptional regulator n=1 Tax=Nocardia mexicana TaxID=279262 RepID=A0A370GGE7_9NOCA|nr:TetR/AcrR family transcriptional regulator [Nocardia mexicana]RDI42741.1 TetR family transcriptional regulator [Nocardia mexicana]